MNNLSGKMEEVVAKMKKNKVPCSTQCAFCHLTTFKTGGKIALLISPDTTAKLVSCLRYLDKAGIKYLVLGRGSNTLASDDFYDGVVVSTLSLNRISVRGSTVRAECGVSSSLLFSALLKNELSGGEFISCIPGTVGAMTAINAGCYGGSMQDVVVGATVFTGGKVVSVASEDMQFGYRSSLVREGNAVVLSVKMRFASGNAVEIRRRAQELWAKKKATQPLDLPSAGSVFFCKEKPASQLIDEAGLKGFSIGGAEVSTKHAGFVVNIDKATSKDIYLLLLHVEKTLREKFGVTPEKEVRLVNFE